MDCKRREFQRQRFTFMCNSVFFKTLDRETRKKRKKNFGKELWAKQKDVKTLESVVCLQGLFSESFYTKMNFQFWLESQKWSL